MLDPQEYSLYLAELHRPVSPPSPRYWSGGEDQLCTTGDGYDEHYLPIWCSECIRSDTCPESPFRERGEGEEE